MRRLAVDRYRETADAFALCLDITPGPERRFHDQGTIGMLRQPPYVARRRAAADLFIGVNEDNRHNRRLEFQIANSTQCQDDLCKSALHIEGTRPVYRIAIDRKRTIVQRTHRPYRVEMAKQQLRRSVFWSVRRHSEHMPGFVRDARLPGVVANTRQCQPQNAAHFVVNLRLCRGRFGFDKGFHQRCERGRLPFDMVENPGRGCCAHTDTTSSLTPGTERRSSGRSSQIGRARDRRATAIRESSPDRRLQNDAENYRPRKPR